jgi:ubiquinone/menaquinone biosynthesis C-methylase UbiE
MSVTRADVLNANIALHTQLADVYKETEPHYRPENQARVEAILTQLAGSRRDARLLDVGCGMGFIIDIAKRHFTGIDGIDITEAMLQRVDTSAAGCEITVRIAEVEALPFADNSYDAVTAYAVIHHLHSLKPAFEEIFRVLKPGGWFYTDTDPNFYFWDAMRALPEDGCYAPSVRREIDAVRHKDRELQEEFGVAPELLNMAEILKHDSGGFRAEELEALLREVGFREATVHYEWFVGEARVIHSADTTMAADQIRLVLNELLPLTRHLFKYLRIMARK